MSEVIRTAVIYSCIAFSIVFIVLGGLTAVIYATRLTAGGKAPSSPTSGTGGGGISSASAPAASGGQSAPIAAVDVKARHVAAVTAAILALTQGRGRILSVASAQEQGLGFGISSPTARWRSAALMENVGRRLAPSWKR